VTETLAKVLVLLAVFAGLLVLVVVANRLSARTSRTLLETEEIIRITGARLFSTGLIDRNKFEQWMDDSWGREQRIRRMLRQERLLGLDWRRGPR